MSDESFQFAELIAWLKERGHNEDEIRKIVNHVEVYDQRTGFLSEMDSIEGDEFGIEGIIAKALEGKDIPSDEKTQP